MKKSKPRKKLLTNTPITIGIPKEQLELLAAVPRRSLAALKENRATPTDLYNVSFRIKVGLHLAEKLYQFETEDGMRLAMIACLKVRDRFKANTMLAVTPHEVAEIEMGLEAIDAMQYENIRRELLAAHLAAKAYMHNLI
jgi:hypothetical protein